MHIGYILLLGRIIGMGLERPLVKRLGTGFDSTAVTTLYVGLGQVMFGFAIVVLALGNPGYFDGMQTWLPLSFISAICCAVSFHTFIRAMKVGEVSVLTPLFSIGFIFMYVFDVLAGFASFTWMPLCGVLLVTLGVAFLNPPPSAKTDDDTTLTAMQRFNPLWVLRQPGAVLMLINALGVAVARYVDKTLAPDAEPVLYAMVVNSLAVVVGLVMLTWGTMRNRSGASTRCELPELLRLFVARWKIAIVLVLFGQGAFLLLLYALDYFPPSVIEPVTQLGVFIAVALGGLWFAEPIRTRWLPSAMVVGGAALLLVR